MKKRFLVMAVCVSACMPVSALGAEIAGPAISGTAQENTDNKEETVSEEAIEKKDSGKIEDEITEVQDTVTVAADTDVLDYPGRKEGSVIGEVLEEDEFEPMFDGCKDALKDKKIALFGSYGWGDGEWMRNWEESCKEAGAVLATESVICNDMPDDDGVENCKALGAALA